MPSHRISFHWSKSSTEGRMDGARDLTERLRPAALDRAASAQEVVREAATQVRSWMLERPGTWADDGRAAGKELESGLRDWEHQQAWRGSCARFLHGLRTTFSGHGEAQGLRDTLVQELDAWLGEQVGVTRLPDPAHVSPHALHLLERGDEVLIHGYSPVLLECLGAAQRSGLFPRVTVAASAADQSGKRSARQLASHGIPVQLLWDSNLIGAVRNADQLWLATEGAGPGAFLALAGTGAVLAEARRQEIPSHVLCTTDVCLPAGEMQLPAWGQEDTWNLWSQAPEGVVLEAQPFEIVEAEHTITWITEEGTTDLGTLCMHHLFTEPAAPCGSTHDEAPGPNPCVPPIIDGKTLR